MENNGNVVTSDEPNYRGVKAMPFVIGNETFEKLGTIGTSSNLLVYLTTVFNMSSISATNLINIFNGTCNFGTLVGAFLSDTYLGRYKTLGFASISSFMGMLLLTLTAAISILHPPSCGTGKCQGPTVGQLAFLFTSFALLVIGAGGIRPCNLAFGADQFNPNTDSGRRGITSFFNWYYFTYTFAMMVSLTVIIYLQSSVNWALGLAIPTFLMFLSCASFFVGTKLYVRVIPKGSPLTGVMQVIVAAIKKRKINLEENSELTLFNYVPANSTNSKLPHTNQFGFLDKAAIVTAEDEINSDGSAVNPWTLSNIQQVEEVKCLLRVLPIWLAGMFYYVTLVQQNTYVVFQALQSDRCVGNGNFKIPAASYTVFSMLSLTIWIPVYDRILVPLLRKVTKKEEGITILQRMAIGIVISVISMIVSGLVENQRRTWALTKPMVGFLRGEGNISSLSGSWLIPQLVLIGLSEAFAIIGEIEFFYKQFPENMRSFAGSFLFCGFAVSSYFCSFLISLVHRVTQSGKSENWLAEDLNKGKLDYYYYMIAGLEVANLGYFLVCAKWYRYKGTAETNPEEAMEKMQSGKNMV